MYFAEEILQQQDAYIQKGEMLNRPALGVREKVLAKHMAYIEKYNEMSDAKKMGSMGTVK